MNNSIIPNLFIIGAAKCGTTSLCINLAKHQDVFLPKNKEPQYIVSKFIKLPRNGPGDDQRDKNIISELDEYLDLYKESRNIKYRIDGTVDIIYYPGSEKEIKQLNPAAKIIIILRNPVERAYSAYKMLKNMHMNQREQLSFEDALKKEEERIENNFEFIWEYKRGGMYFEHVSRFISEFGTDNVKVLLLDDIMKDSEAEYKKIFDFLEIPHVNNISENVYNRSASSVHPKLFLKFKKLTRRDNVLKKAFKKIIPNQDKRLKIYDNIIKILFSKKSLKMKEETRRYLIQYFKDDISKLSKLLDRDLSAWVN